MNTALAARLGIDPSLHDLWAQLDTDTQVATALVALCYFGHGWDLGKNRYLARKWWDEFLPARVRLCARTSETLSEFTSELSQKLRGQVGGRDSTTGAGHRLLWQELIGLPAERQRRIIDVLDRDAETCVTLMRAHQDTRRQAWENIHGEATTQAGRGEHDDHGPGLFDLARGDESIGGVPADAGATTDSGPPL